MDWQDFSITGPFEQLIADFEGAFRRILPSYLFSFPESSFSTNAPFDNGTNNIVHYPSSSTTIKAVDNQSHAPSSTSSTVSASLAENDDNIIRTTYVSLPLIDNTTHQQPHHQQQQQQNLILSLTYVNIPLYKRRSITLPNENDEKEHPSYRPPYRLHNRYPQFAAVTGTSNHYNADVLYRIPVWYGEDHFIMIRTSSIVSSNDLIQNLSTLHPNLLLPYMFDPSLCKKVLSAATIALEHLELIFLPSSSSSSSSSDAPVLARDHLLNKRIEYIRSLSLFVQLYEPSKNAFLGHAIHRYRKPSSTSVSSSSSCSPSSSLSTGYIQTIYRTDEVVSRSWLAPSYLAYTGCGTLSSAPIFLRDYSPLLYNFAARLIDNRTLSLRAGEPFLPDASQISPENLQRLKAQYQIQCNVNYKWRVGITNSNNFLSSSSEARTNPSQYRTSSSTLSPVRTIDVQSIWSDQNPFSLRTSGKDALSSPPSIFPESPLRVTLTELAQSSLFTLRIHWSENSWITRTNLFYPSGSSTSTEQFFSSSGTPSTVRMNPTVAELFFSTEDTVLSSSPSAPSIRTPRFILDTFYPSGFLLSTLQNNLPFCTIASRLVILYEAFETTKVLASLDIDNNYLLSVSKYRTNTLPSSPVAFHRSPRPYPVTPQVIAELQSRNMSNLTSPGFGMPMMMNTVTSETLTDDLNTSTSMSSPSVSADSTDRNFFAKQELSGYGLGSECLLTLPVRSIPSLYNPESTNDNGTVPLEPLWQGTSRTERNDIEPGTASSGSRLSESVPERNTNLHPPQVYEQHLRKRDRLWNVIHQIRQSATDRFDNTLKLPFRNRLNEIQQARNDVQTMITNALESAKLVFGGAKMVQDKVNDLSQYLMEEDLIQILNEISNAEESVRNNASNHASADRSYEDIGPSAASSSALTTFTHATLNLIQRILVDPINQQQEFHIHRFEALMIPENSDITSIPAKDIGIPSYFGLGRISPSFVTWAQDPTIQYTTSNGNGSLNSSHHASSSSSSSSSPSFVNINECIARYHILQDIIVNVICTCWSIFVRSLRNEWDELYHDYTVHQESNRLSTPTGDNTSLPEYPLPLLSLSAVSFDQCIIQQKLDLLKLHTRTVTKCIEDGRTIDKYRIRSVSSQARTVYSYSKHYPDTDGTLETVPIEVSKPFTLLLQYSAARSTNHPSLPLPTFHDQPLFLLQPLFVSSSNGDGANHNHLQSLPMFRSKNDSSLPVPYKLRLFPLIIPPLDDIVPTTLDVVLKDQQQLLQAGLGIGKFVSIRTIHNPTTSVLSCTNRLSFDILAQDMRVFRLYNPLAGLIDFLRYYFPLSWTNAYGTEMDPDWIAFLASVRVHYADETTLSTAEDTVSLTKIGRSLLCSMQGSFEPLGTEESSETFRVRWMMDTDTNELKLSGNSDSTIVQHKILRTIWDSFDTLVQTMHDTSSDSSSPLPPVSPTLYKNRSSFRLAETVESIFDYFESLPVSELMGQLFSSMLTITSESLQSIMKNTAYALGNPTINNNPNDSSSPLLPILTPAYHRLRSMMKTMNHNIESYSLSSMNRSTLFTNSSLSSGSNRNGSNDRSSSSSVYRTPTKENTPNSSYRSEQNSSQRTTENNVSPRELYQAFKESRLSFMETLSTGMREFSASVTDFETLNYRQQWLSSYLTENTTLLNSMDTKEMIKELSRSSLSLSSSSPAESSLSSSSSTVFTSSSVQNIRHAEGLSRFYYRRIISPLVYSLTNPWHTVHHNLQLDYSQNILGMKDTGLVKLYHQMDGIPCIVSSSSGSPIPSDPGNMNGDKDDKPSYLYLHGGGAGGSGTYSGSTEYSCSVAVIFGDAPCSPHTETTTIVTKIQRQLVMNLLYQQSILKGVPSPSPLNDIFASILLPVDEITNLLTSTLPRYNLPTFLRQDHRDGNQVTDILRAIKNGNENEDSKENMTSTSLVEHRMYVHIDYDSVRTALRIHEDDGYG